MRRRRTQNVVGGVTTIVTEHENIKEMDTNSAPPGWDDTIANELMGISEGWKKIRGQLSPLTV